MLPAATTGSLTCQVLLAVVVVVTALGFAELTTETRLPGAGPCPHTLTNGPAWSTMWSPNVLAKRSSGGPAAARRWGASGWLSATGRTRKATAAARNLTAIWWHAAAALC
jgi:hypothetical protein